MRPFCRTTREVPLIRRPRAPDVWVPFRVLRCRSAVGLVDVGPEATDRIRRRWVGKVSFPSVKIRIPRRCRFEVEKALSLEEKRVFGEARRPGWRVVYE